MLRIAIVNEEPQRVGRPLSSDARLHSAPARKAVFGVLCGLALGLVANGHVSLGSVIGNLQAGATVSAAIEHADEGRFRVTLQCPLKNKRVKYSVKASNAGAAHIALQWVLPACALVSLSQGDDAGPGSRWYAGVFACQGDRYRKIVAVDADSISQARVRAMENARQCDVMTIDQTDCSALDPHCHRQSEDLSIEAELSRTHLLR